MPDSISDTFHGMLAPAGTPPEIVDRLAAVLMDSLKRPEFREKLRTLGFDVIGKGPDAMRRRISEEVTRYRDIIAKAGIERM